MGRSGRARSGKRSLPHFHSETLAAIVPAPVRLALENRPKIAIFLLSFTMPCSHAALLHFWRIPRRSLDRLHFWSACRLGDRPGIRRPRALAPPAGLRPRRTYEDQPRHRPHPPRRAQREDHRPARRYDPPESGLAKLERVVAGRAGEPRKAQRRRLPPPRTRR